MVFNNSTPRCSCGVYLYSCGGYKDHVPGHTAVMPPKTREAPKQQQHPRSKAFHEAANKIKELHDAKQSDYGTNVDPFANVSSAKEFGIEPWVGACVRMNDKINRLKAMALHGKLKNEPVEDSLLDIAVYSLIAYVLFTEDHGEA